MLKISLLQINRSSCTKINKKSFFLSLNVYLQQNRRFAVAVPHNSKKESLKLVLSKLSSWSL